MDVTAAQMLPGERLRQLLPAGRVTDAELPTLDTALSALLARCRQEWPDLDVPDTAFLAFLAERMPAGGPIVEALQSLHASDLYLACGCALRQAAAHAALERSYLGEVQSYVGRIDGSAAFVDEVRQRLRERILLSEANGRPRIAEYTGKGALGAWLRAVSVRLALDLRRGAVNAAAPGEEEDEPAKLSAPVGDPELDYLKIRYRNEYRAALSATLSALSPDERNVLRLHYLDGLSIDEIGLSYRVHRSTVARWIARARGRILEEVRRRLSNQLKVETEEVDSIMRLVQSQLDVSLRHFFTGG